MITSDFKTTRSSAQNKDVNRTWNLFELGTFGKIRFHEPDRSVEEVLGTRQRRYSVVRTGACSIIHGPNAYSRILYSILRSNAGRFIALFGMKCLRTSRYFQNDVKTRFMTHLAIRRSQDARSEKRFLVRKGGKKEKVFNAVPSVLLSTRCGLFGSALKKRIRKREKNNKLPSLIFNSGGISFDCFIYLFILTPR